MTAVSGCSTSDKENLTHAVYVPPLPADLARVPADPGLPRKVDAEVGIAITRRGLAQCRAQYIDLRNFHQTYTNRNIGRKVKADE